MHAFKSSVLLGEAQVFDLLCNEIIRVDGYLFQQVLFYSVPDTSTLSGYDFD